MIERQLVGFIAAEQIGAAVAEVHEICFFAFNRSDYERRAHALQIRVFAGGIHNRLVSLLYGISYAVGERTLTGRLQHLLQSLHDDFAAWLPRCVLGAPASYISKDGTRPTCTHHLTLLVLLRLTKAAMRSSLRLSRAPLSVLLPIWAGLPKIMAPFIISSF